ncbi:MAG: hypothetical protein V4628_08005 [Pseudomonadota bacterium]
MRNMLLVITLGLTGCAIPHLEGTETQDTALLARLNSVDRETRLVKLDDARIRTPAGGGYFVKPGARKLEFQLHVASAGAPGKNNSGGSTPLNDFIEACIDLKPGYDYLIEVNKEDPQAVLVVNERNAGVNNQNISTTC